MHSARRAPLFALATLAMVASSAAAQQTPTFSLEVTEATEAIEQVGTVRRIDRAFIDAHQARTLDEALRLVPGIFVRTGGDGTARLDVRGFRSRHVLLLIDGVPYNSTADGQFDPAAVSTESIREIKVSYGSSSVLYGDNALAAVVEIITTGEPRGATAEVAIGTPDQREAGVRLARVYGPVDVTVSGSAFSTDGFRLPGAFAATSAEAGGTRDNSDRSRGDLRVNVGYAMRPTIRIGSEWTFGTGAYGTPPSAIADATDIFAQRVRYARVDDYRNVSGQLSVAFVPAGRLNLRAWAYRNQQRQDRAEYDDPTYSSMDDPLVPGTFQSRDRTTISGSAALGRIDLGRAGWLRLAVNQRREAFTSDGVIRDVPLGTPGGSGSGGGGGRTRAAAPVSYALRTFTTDHHADIYAAGTEWQFRPAAAVATVLGAAVDWQDRVDAGPDAEPTWIAGLSYDVTRSLRVHASATRKIRFPSIDQLYDEAAGNAALQPERADGVDAGVDRQIGRASQAGISLFSTHAVNFIERDAGSPFSNRHSYRFSGAEASFQTQLIPAVDLRFAYNFLDAVDLDASAGEAMLQTRPRHRATLDTAWRATPSSTARVTLYGVADQRFDSRGTPTVQRHAGDYTLVDASLTQALSRRYEIVVSVTNLFDRLYEQAYGFPREGRKAVLRLRARLD